MELITIHTYIHTYILLSLRMHRNGDGIFLKGLKLWQFGNISSDFNHIFIAHAQKRLCMRFRL